MSQQEKPLNDLSPFEAALAGLAPRVEGFDRERLIFLAGQAAALREAGVPALAGFSRQSPPTIAAQRCPGGTPARCLAWPAAFAAMTAVAASLLVMLCTRTGPMIASAGVETKNTGSNLVSRHDVQAEEGTRPVSRCPVRDTSPGAMPDWLASWLSPSASPTQPAEAAVDAAYADSDPALRAELLRHGIEFRRARMAASTGPIVIAEGPLPYYELLKRLTGKGPAGQGG